ncbi:LOW QUALITY PROTEIN: LEAF RUST 10 DISEASE-RESISTANCE LOCUS RECEPTOR-LIKE PROTEIN KINASE-like 2.1 [Juglans microcarpa x Juglans regia]|uniref:LOW QUALITY PROTEIN: LEAF RUST 10 DISEASE-RESISTANCE LOCUS RECEPTOR-LIKE PROTEIN KINASE-like 2.1 n=1 Tax=Juglans microcarpa x Juglans regia TaxID=2249226 RepID=UPI001B7E9A79|nr:LOW QUALITY PROTEIN: LEAF RUST 10 DISEASE-RESISTANCE LOCUS RECEPTOR-LIKE PROTEIN KINASE-like 2.1 [Juglans microcarpa x Juglans regia]
MNLGYPFWGSNRPEYCGYPGFELNCSGDLPQLNVTNMYYRVLNIDDAARSLQVARVDYWNTTCPATYANTSIDSSTLFSHDTSATTNLTLYYQCSTTSSLFPIQPAYGFSFTCAGDATGFTNYYSRSLIASTLLGVCEYNVKVPVVTEAGILTTEDLLKEAIDGGFTVGWNANNRMCDRCDGSGGRCGFNTSTNAFACHCKTGSFPSTCDESDGSSTRLNWWLIMTIGLAGIAVLSFVIICSVKRGYLSNNSMVWWKRDAKNDHFTAEEILRNFGSMAPKRYTYSDVKKLTNSFKYKVGQGGYGVVFKGELPDGHIVAVKVLGESKGNGEEFINEVASISRTSHVNIVTLLGFCYERTKRALIYEFVQNGSLDKFIHEKGSSITNCYLDSKTMFQIAVGIARGLEYLHRGCRTRILHFDIKPHNILLDENLCPKISDFGLAKLCKTKDISIVSMTGIRGTAGYIAPEVFSQFFGGVSHKSDVYSYGMLVLEMVAGRKNLDDGVLSHSSENYFPNWIYDKLEKGETCDTSGITDDDQDNMIKRMIMVSLWCIQTNPSDRPSMGKVIEMLGCNSELPQFPPKPFLNSPTRSA